MPRLSSQSKHEEFESNSTLHIRIKRKEGAEVEKEDKQRNFALVLNLVPASTVHPAALFTIQPLFTCPAF